MVPNSHKCSVVKIYLLSTGLYNASTWPDLPPTLKKKVHKSVLGLCHSALPQTFSEVPPRAEFIADAELVSQHDLVIPDSLIRLARLSLLSRIAVKSPPALCLLLESTFSVLALSHSWVASVLNDLIF